MSHASRRQPHDEEERERILQIEAERLMLTRVAAAPESWRFRASTGAGLLSAAAAASLWGLLSRRPEDLETSTSTFAAIASGLFTLAVILFLIATLRPSPNRGELLTEDYIASLHSYADDEVAPIKSLTIWASRVSAAAIMAVAASALSIVLDSQKHDASIFITSKEGREAVRGTCPNVSQPFDAVVARTAEGAFTIEIRDCGLREQRTVTFTFQQSEVIVLDKS